MNYSKQIESRLLDQKLKVLLISPLPPPIGGIATLTSNLIDFYKSNPEQIDLVVCNTTTIKFRSITSQSFIMRIYSGLINSIRIFLNVKKLIKKEVPHLIHLASSSSFALFKDYMIIYIAKHYKIPVIMHWHFGRIPSLASKENWEWKLLRYIIRRSTFSIVIDSKSYETLLAAGFINIINIPNPLGLDIEQKSRSIVECSNRRQSGRLIFVGHIVRNKGVYELVEASSQLPLIKELLFIGPCEETVKNELRILARKRENGSWLNFIGELNKDQLLEYMFNSPVLVLPSYTEGFPNAVIEGMAMGCAIIATNVGAIPEILDINGNKACGICVPPNNIEKLKEAISELIKDPSKTETMGQNGIKRVTNNYTIEKISKEYKIVWENAKNRYFVDNIATNKSQHSQISSSEIFKRKTTRFCIQDIKVLLISPLPPPIGGIASWTINLMNYFSNNQSKIKLTLLNSALKGKSITSSSLAKRYYSGIYTFLWIHCEFKKLIKTNKPCLIHMVSSSSLALFKDYFMIRKAKKHKLPVVMHWRFGRIPSLAKQNNWEWKLLNIIIKRSILSIVIDSKSYNTLRNAGFTNIINIPNPLGLSIEQRSRALVGKTYQRQQGRLIFVGHIVRSKGVFELVEACSQIPIIKELSLIGPCEEKVKRDLRALASKLGNGAWLNFIGELSKDQVLEHMLVSPVLVLPSYTEGFPNAVLEGMAMGCAVIATNVGAIPEMLDIKSDKPCGICAPPKNIEKLKEAILKLLQDPFKAETMGKNGIDKVLKNYTIERITKQYTINWENIANSHTKCYIN